MLGKSKIVLRHDTAIQLCCRAAAIRAVCPALQRDSILQVAPIRLLSEPFPKPSFDPQPEHSSNKEPSEMNLLEIHFDPAPELSAG